MAYIPILNQKGRKRLQDWSSYAERELLQMMTRNSLHAEGLFGTIEQMIKNKRSANGRNHILLKVLFLLVRSLLLYG